MSKRELSLDLVDSLCEVWEGFVLMDHHGVSKVSPVRGTAPPRARPCPRGAVHLSLSNHGESERFLRGNLGAKRPNPPESNLFR